MEQIMAAVQENGSTTSSLSTVIWVLEIVGLWKMFEKAGLPGWVGIVPFYNYYKLCEKVLNNGWVFLGLCIPVIRWYFKYLIGAATAKAYGKPDEWKWGYMFLPFAFYLLTGFDDSSYYGPYGSGDTRTGEAREARTVDFDVVKNQAPAEPVAEEIKDEPVVQDVDAETIKESEVEFDFNQDNVGE